MRVFYRRSFQFPRFSKDDGILAGVDFRQLAGTVSDDNRSYRLRVTIPAFVGKERPDFC